MRHLLVVGVILVISALSCSAADARHSVAEKAILTSEELQNLLGIASWRVKIPESYGPSAKLLLERYIGGKRVEVHEIPLDVFLETGSSRQCMITLREENDEYRISSNLVGAARNLSTTIKLTNAPPHVVLLSESEPQTTNTDIVLLKKLYVKGGGIEGIRSLANRSGTMFMRIAKNNDPRSSE